MIVPIQSNISDKQLTLPFVKILPYKGFSREAYYSKFSR